MSSTQSESECPIRAAAAAISQHDKQVIDLIFNSGGELTLAALQPPELQQSGDHHTIDDDEDAMALDDKSGSEASMPRTPTADEAISPELLAQLKAMEMEAIQRAETGNLPGAIEQFSEAIAQCPTYASAYNNRAQAYRMAGDLDRAFEDLSQAIKYGEGNASILRQAYTQRGIIEKRRGNADSAFHDFERGARYGNPVAREAAVRENPYAKMCNAMVMEAMHKLQGL